MIDQTEESTPVVQSAPTTIGLGGFGPSLREQGFDRLLPSHRVDFYMRCDEAITVLHVGRVISYSAHVTARKRLAKIIDAEIIKNRSEVP